jgi:pimeloyl-[acyl-carrier protein] synthase
LTAEVTIGSLNLASPAFIADPYGTYATIRRSRLEHSSTYGAWIAADHDTVAQVLRDRSFIGTAPPRDDLEGSPLSLQAANGPDHVRLHAAIAPAFHSTNVSRLVRGIEDHIEQLIADITPNETVDFMSRVAHPLSVRVMTDVLGVPQSIVPRLARAAVQVANTMGDEENPELTAAGEAGMRLAVDLLAEVADSRRRSPTSDLITALVTHRDLSAGEAERMMRLLFFAGTFPVALAIGNAVATLMTQEQLGHPLPQVDRPDVLASTVEECLRFEAVIQIVVRRAARSCSLQGSAISAGEDIMLLLGSANRDELVFQRADEFDPDRKPNPHFGLGLGEHSCVAASLARAELRTVIRALFANRCRIGLTDSPALWLRRSVLRGLETLPVQFCESDVHTMKSFERR